MENKDLSFDAYAYFEQLTKENKLVVNHKFKFTRVTNEDELEEVMTNMRSNSAFFALDDSSNGIVYQPGNGGFFRKRVLSVFLLKRGRLNNMDDYVANMNICRDIFNQVCSRMIKDGPLLFEKNIQLNLDQLVFKQIENTLINGASGFYFMFNVVEPINLCYNDNEWTTEG